MSYYVLDVIRFPCKYFKATGRSGDGKSDGGTRCVLEGNERQDSSSSRSVFLLAEEKKKIYVHTYMTYKAV